MDDFFVWVREENTPFHNCAMTEVERGALMEVFTMMKRASDETPWPISNEELIASGWPVRIRPVAEQALTIFLKRGRFSDEFEEAEPSSEQASPATGPA